MLESIGIQFRKMDSFSSFSCIFFSLLLILSSSQAQLSSSFYDTSCPNALATVRTSIRRAVSAERRMAAKLIRLHFHDCFVQGCDASILLDNSATIDSEQFASNNENSIAGLDVIAAAKTDVERICPGVVSCADIVAVAARDASFAVGGPSWTVKLGRRDSTTASRDLANANLPLVSDNLQTLLDLFLRKGLNAREMVALSGSHTLGQARCFVFRDRIYDNTSVIDPIFAGAVRRGCPVTRPDGDSHLAPLDLMTPNSFDNKYYRNLISRRGLLASDQILFSNGSSSTASIVDEYSQNPAVFASDFAAAMVKMGDIEPLTGTEGQIRTACNVVN